LRDKEIGLTPSIIDRLIDLDPRVSTEPPRSRLSRLADLKQSVRRDLEWLLNTRCFLASEVDENLDEVNSSLAVYGLPDFTSISAKDPLEQKRMLAAIENAIRLFEPRFLGVKVTFERVQNTDKQLTFRIEASLDVEPVPEPIVFDTVLQVGGSGFDVVEK
jgi:type VI secretion system protein ImpF